MREKLVPPAVLGNGDNSPSFVSSANLSFTANKRCGRAEPKGKQTSGKQQRIPSERYCHYCRLFLASIDLMHHSNFMPLASKWHLENTMVEVHRGSRDINPFIWSI